MVDLPTIPLDKAQPGDIGFAHTPGFLGGGIRLAEWREGKPYNNYNHAFLLSRYADNEWYVYQAQAKGTCEVKLSTVDPNGTIIVVPLAAYGYLCPLWNCYDSMARELLLLAARDMLNYEYGFLTDASIMINQLTPDKLDIRKPGTLICSAFVARAMERATFRMPDDPFQINPAQLLKLAKKPRY